MSTHNIADEIAKLAALKDDGVLSESEFAEAKRKLLAGTAPQPTAPQNPEAPQQDGFSGVRVLGLLLAFVGLGIAGYFLLMFDTSVGSGGYRVNNLGLMSDRQNGLIGGGILAVVGILIGLTRRKN